MIDAVLRRMLSLVLQPACLGQSWESGFFCGDGSWNGRGEKRSGARSGSWIVHVGESAISRAGICQHMTDRSARSGGSARLSRGKRPRRKPLLGAWSRVHNLRVGEASWRHAADSEKG